MRVKFCATTQFDATKAHESFNKPFSLEQGLNKQLIMFLNPKRIVFLILSKQIKC